jgi:hypothetical protein
MNTEIELRDYLAGQAMLAVMQETQEVVPASFFDWLKQLAYNYLHATFLKVKYREIDNVYYEAAKRAYKYADAMISER